MLEPLSSSGYQNPYSYILSVRVIADFNKTEHVQKRKKAVPHQRRIYTRTVLVQKVPYSGA